MPIAQGDDLTLMIVGWLNGDTRKAVNFEANKHGLEVILRQKSRANSLLHIDSIVFTDEELGSVHFRSLFTERFTHAANQLRKMVGE